MWCFSDLQCKALKKSSSMIMEETAPVEKVGFTQSALEGVHQEEAEEGGGRRGHGGGQGGGGEDRVEEEEDMHEEARE